MSEAVQAKRVGGRVVISPPTGTTRLKELGSKKGQKTEHEVLEEILLRVKRIEDRLGIRDE